MDLAARGESGASKRHEGLLGAAGGPLGHDGDSAQVLQAGANSLYLPQLEPVYLWSRGFSRGAGGPEICLASASSLQPSLLIPPLDAVEKTPPHSLVRLPHPPAGGGGGAVLSPPHGRGGRPRPRRLVHAMESASAAGHGAISVLDVSLLTGTLRCCYQVRRESACFRPFLTPCCPHCTA